MPNNWAITVGINDYEFLPNASLRFAVNDALAMRSFLCEQAGFEKEQVLLCGDGEETGTRKATRAVLRDILKHQLQRAKKADNLWFFFSGHGMAGRNQDYLIPTDGNPTDLEETALPLSFVISQLRACQAKNIVLVLDMCRNEVQKIGQKNVNLVGKGLRSLVQEREGQQGVITLFSCRQGQSSFEKPELGHGTFTYALLQGLKEHTLLKDLERYLERRVPELNESHRGIRKQLPLLIPEPGWKYEEPIFNHYLTHGDLQKLKEIAMNAQLDGEIQKAINTWEKVNLLSPNLDDRRRALQQITLLSTASSTMGSIHYSEDANKEVLKGQESQTLKIGDEAEISRIESERDLPSGNSISYAYLCDLLSAKDWYKADKETLRIMLVLGKRETDGWLNSDSLKVFPCSDIHIIDQLWTKYSNGKYGFTIQKKIWDEHGGPNAYHENYKNFGVCVGWRQGEKWNSKFSKLNLDTPGVLPRFGLGARGGGPGSVSWRGRFFTFIQRISYCHLQQVACEPTNSEYSPKPH